MTDEAPAVRQSGYTWAVVFVLLGMAAIALGAFLTLGRSAPPPPDVASDPVLKLGREAYLDRCVGCHGPEGKGDGPLAKSVTGPPVGNLASGRWKVGDRPEDVVGMIAKGTPNSMMPGWLSTLGPERVDAVAAYVYYLGGKPVPESLRAGAVVEP